jgi:hypothetical protein
MEENFNNRDFERFVRENADQYRMFPSEKVWNGIDNALHTRRKWYGLGLALLLLLTGAGVSLVMITTPATKNQEEIAALTARETSRTSTVPEKTKPVFNKNINGPLRLENSNQPEENTVARTHSDPAAASGTLLITDVTSLRTETPVELVSLPVESKTHRNNNQTASPEIAAVRQSMSEETLRLPVAISIPVVEANQEPQQPVDVAKTAPSEQILTIESVVNSYKRPLVKKKISWQLYFSPTISYRKLAENKYFLRSAALNGNVPMFAAYNDVKNVVTHKPAIGLELGLAARYPLSKALTVRTGLQFNVSRYDIKAFTYPGEIATIALDAGSGSNSISRQTTYRTRSGNRANWLQNFYYSVSLPVGLEVNVARQKPTSFGFAATIQPTYIVSDRAYLLSTDFKNYVEVPSLIRRWNMNTSFETFVSYKSGNVRWQIGPQVRYQLRSSFDKRYPFKENLFDFGLKVGITFNQ